MHASLAHGSTAHVSMRLSHDTSAASGHKMLHGDCQTTLSGVAAAANTKFKIECVLVRGSKILRGREEVYNHFFANKLTLSSKKKAGTPATKGKSPRPPAAGGRFGGKDVWFWCIFLCCAGIGCGMPTRCV